MSEVVARVEFEDEDVIDSMGPPAVGVHSKEEEEEEDEEEAPEEAEGSWIGGGFGDGLWVGRRRRRKR